MYVKVNIIIFFISYFLDNDVCFSWSRKLIWLHTNSYKKLYKDIYYI